MKPVLTITAYLLLVGAVIICAYSDYQIWKANLNAESNYLDHEMRWYLKALSCIPAVLTFAWRYGKSLYGLLISAVMCMVIFWFGFDITYNLYRGFPPFYLGSDDAVGNSVSEDFLRMLPIWVGVGFKVVLIAAITAIYYKWVKR